MKTPYSNMVLLLLGLYLLTYYPYCGAQNVGLEGCPSLVTKSELTTIIENYICDQFNAAAELLQVLPDIEIEDVYINCLSAGNIRGYYRQATYTVNYTGDPINSGTTLAQVDIVCDDNGLRRVWKLTQNSNFKRITNPSDQLMLANNDTILTDCSSCNGKNNFDSQKDDSLRHCLRCPDECLNNNLTLCYGDNSTQCCNVYIGDHCAVECPANFTADESTNFTCDCDLECQNGGSANNDCNMCDCPLGITGIFCETVLNQCDPNPCENGGSCIPCSYPSYICECLPAFTGNNCSTILDPFAVCPSKGTEDCNKALATLICCKIMRENNTPIPHICESLTEHLNNCL